MDAGSRGNPYNGSDGAGFPLIVCNSKTAADCVSTQPSDLYYEDWTDD